MEDYPVWETVKRKRKHMGMTQAELGSKVGVCQTTVSEWENLFKFPKPVNMAALSDVLGISKGRLYGTFWEARGEE